jgi:hypothetical protein
MNDLYRRALDCPHTIQERRITLEFDPDQPGHNALNQLGLRLEASLPIEPRYVAAGPFYLYANDSHTRGFLVYGTGIHKDKPEFIDSMRHSHPFTTFEEADTAANRAGLMVYAVLQPAVGIPQ